MVATSPACEVDLIGTVYWVRLKLDLTWLATLGNLRTMSRPARMGVLDGAAGWLAAVRRSQLDVRAQARVDGHVNVLFGWLMGLTVWLGECGGCRVGCGAGSRCGGWMMRRMRRLLGREVDAGSRVLACRALGSVVAVVGVVAWAASAASAASPVVVQTFGPSGQATEQMFEVPEVTSLQVTVQGADGGRGYPGLSIPGLGGQGTQITGTIAVQEPPRRATSS
jgi:hypothetical protein